MDQPSPDKLTFRSGMAKLAAAVNVVSSDGPGGLSGATVSAVCSVTDSPPSLLVCVNRSSRSHAIITANGVLCVNVLDAASQGIAHLFAGGTAASPTERFEKVEHSKLETGSPVLDAAIVSFDCEVEQVIDFGTHSIFLARVVGMASREGGEGLMYFGRRYFSTNASHAIGADVPLSIAFDLQWL